MKKCPECGYEGMMIDDNGYLLTCPVCNITYNEDEI